jgi:hypothetical protein
VDLVAAFGRDAWLCLLLLLAVPCADPLELLLVDFFGVSKLDMMLAFVMT